MSDAYWTMDTAVHRVGLVVAEAAASSAGCSWRTTRSPRTARGAAPPLSDAEVALGLRARSRTRASFVRFPIVEAADASLVGRLARSCGRRRRGRCRRTPAPRSPPTRDYEVASATGTGCSSAAPLAGSVLGEGWTAVATVARRATSSALRYEPPYPNVEGAHTVVAADFVSLDDGTGDRPPRARVRRPTTSRSAAPRAGRSGKPVGDDGRSPSDAPAFVRGIVREGRRPGDRRGPARRAACCSAPGPIEHAYPFCWRCQTPLLYYARTVLVRPDDRGARTGCSR